MKTVTRGRWLPRILLAPLAAIPLAAAGCSGNVVTGSTAVPAATESPTVTGAAVTETVIEYTSDGFVPDQVDVAEGSRVMVRNTTDSAITFVVQGREDGASTEERTVEPGESVDLGLARVGAYILSLTDDPLVTAGVFIS